LILPRPIDRCRHAERLHQEKKRVNYSPKTVKTVTITTFVVAIVKQNASTGSAADFWRKRYATTNHAMPNALLFPQQSTDCGKPVTTTLLSAVLRLPTLFSSTVSAQAPRQAVYTSTRPAAAGRGSVCSSVHPRAALAPLGGYVTSCDR
jgi:hypothetical protein